MGEKILTPAFNPMPGQPCYCSSGRRFSDCCGSKAADRPPPHGVHLVRGFLDAATCSDWVRILDQQPSHATGIMKDDQVVVSRKRITERVFLGPVEQAVTDLMHRVFTTTIPSAINTELEWFERPQILRYRPGGHYWLHADSERYIKEKRAWQKTLDRDVSLLLYLNDDFQGGELSFFAMNYVYQPRLGDLLFFPSDHRYAHRAHEVTEGRRYVVVSWAAARGEPKVHEAPPDNHIAI
ncbi:MAG: hypothetical protein HKO64_01950 [Xanthomonadales bacterium]|nr:2OG-Fe(II) oxygenase [Gammaproteobacteria bacterium]NNE05204.1 hypothetical protein [Xanthomonadales bacterium]NNL94364.1 hypothetical protein [Xanthomonadales bacterium]